MRIVESRRRSASGLPAVPKPRSMGGGRPWRSTDSHPVRISEVQDERAVQEPTFAREWDAPLAGDDGLPLRHQKRSEPAPPVASMR
jgi:hypothetical protein